MTLYIHIDSRRLVLVDPSPPVRVAGQIPRSNVLDAVIEVATCRTEDIVLPTADVIASDFTGHFLLEEDRLPILSRPRDRCLEPGGVVIPDCTTIEVALVGSPAFHARHLAVRSEKAGGIG